MKKFLRKLPLMIVLLVLSVALLGTYVGLLARPVATGFTYSHTAHKNDGYASNQVLSFSISEVFDKFDVTTNVKFLNDKKVVISGKLDYEYAKDLNELTKKAVDAFVKTTKAAVETEQETYYFQSGYKIYSLFYVTKDADYDAAVKEFKEQENWQEQYYFTVNAFNVKANSEFDFATDKPLTCANTIVLTVVLGVVEAVLVVFSTLSVVWFVKKKK